MLQRDIDVMRLLLKVAVLGLAFASCEVTRDEAESRPVREGVVSASRPTGKATDERWPPITAKAKRALTALNNLQGNRWGADKTGKSWEDRLFVGRKVQVRAHAPNRDAYPADYERAKERLFDVIVYKRPKRKRELNWLGWKVQHAGSLELTEAELLDFSVRLTGVGKLGGAVQLSQNYRATIGRF